jgi:hypothetical protein
VPVFLGTKNGRVRWHGSLDSPQTNFHCGPCYAVELGGVSGSDGRWAIPRLYGHDPHRRVGADAQQRCLDHKCSSGVASGRSDG